MAAMNVVDFGKTVNKGKQSRQIVAHLKPQEKFLTATKRIYCGTLEVKSVLLIAFLIYYSHQWMIL